MARLRTIDDLGELEGKRVLVRVDFNVPLEDGNVSDDLRIRAAVPTIDRLRKAGASVVLASHLGRPKGVAREDLRLDPVAARLEDISGLKIQKVDDVVGEQAAEASRELDPSGVMMLENLRFHPGEETNDPGFAGELARLAELYVDDAFGAMHRAHASVVGVAERLPAAAGPLVELEVAVLGRLLAGPERPFVAILGGAKISDKLGVVRSLLDRVDALLVGGAMGFTFLLARGGEVGDSLVEEDQVQDAAATLQEAEERGIPVMLPEDVVVADQASASAATEVVPAARIPQGRTGLDVGPRTVETFGRVLTDARSIFWNGPMGMFELEAFAVGTREVARHVADADAFTVVGGGDSIAAIRSLGFEDAIDHLSTGGGASLELLEGKTLPGIEVLEVTS